MILKFTKSHFEGKKKKSKPPRLARFPREEGKGWEEGTMVRGGTMK